MCVAVVVDKVEGVTYRERIAVLHGWHRLLGFLGWQQTGQASSPGLGLVAPGTLATTRETSGIFAAATMIQ